MLRVPIHLTGKELYVARIEPYRISDLQKLIDDIKAKPTVAIETIGRTVQNRPIEVIRVGNPEAPHCVVLRGRAHPWESGSSWVIDGLLRHLTTDDARVAEYLDEYCVYVIPMANIDGVAAGRTRFNMQGCDLNRKWDTPPDPKLCPENYYLEEWLKKVLTQRDIDLMIDFHNDAGGQLHISRPEIPEPELKAYLDRMQRLETLLRENSWFTEGSTGSSFHNPGSLGEGMLQRYGIPACIHELNANHIAGLNQPPSATAWKQYGRRLCEVLYLFVRE